MSEVAKFGQLKPTFMIHLELAEPQPFVSNARGTETVVMVKKGYTKTLSPEFPMDLEITLGWDILRTFVDKPGVSILDCDLFGKSSTSGAGVHIWYDGVVQMTETALAVIRGESKGFEVDEGYVTCHPTFQFGDESAPEAWSNGKNFLGKGKFLRDEQGALQIEYYVYVLA